MGEIYLLKQKIIDSCLYLKENKLIFGTWGNISIRINNAIFITPSRIAYEKMKPENIVKMNFKGEIIEGNFLPSSESELHRLIYLTRKDIGSVIHFHSTYAMAASCIGKNIPAISEEICQVIGNRIPCTKKYVPAGHHTELAKEAIKYIGNVNALLLKNHGPVCFGPSIEDALEVSEVLEKAAMIYLNLLKSNKRFFIIPDKYVKEEQFRYQNIYKKQNI